jgi:hypothetical protein
MWVSVKVTGDRFALCNFESDKEFQIVHYKKGDEISVVGKIAEIDDGHIVLGECDVVS